MKEIMSLIFMYANKCNNKKIHVCTSNILYNLQSIYNTKSLKMDNRLTESIQNEQSFNNIYISPKKEASFAYKTKIKT